MRVNQSGIPAVPHRPGLHTGVVSGFDGYVAEIKPGVLHSTPEQPLTHEGNFMKEIQSVNIDLPESVNEQADKLENNPELMLRLVDLIFFLDDRDPIPS